MKRLGRFDVPRAWVITLGRKIASLTFDGMEGDSNHALAFGQRILSSPKSSRLPGRGYRRRLVDSRARGHRRLLPGGRSRPVRLERAEYHRLANGTQKRQ